MSDQLKNSIQQRDMWKKTAKILSQNSNGIMSEEEIQANQKFKYFRK